MSIPQEEHIEWPEYYRIISSRYPPIDIFERIADPEEWESLYEIESMTNPRIREDIGKIALVPKDKRVTGSGASYVMSSFTHISPGKPSRFSNGQNFGVYYVAKIFETALIEVAYHRAEFFKATNDPPLTCDERVLKGSINAKFHDIRPPRYKDLHNPDSYQNSQDFARNMRAANSNGLIYNSVRHQGGECIAAFWPNVVGLPIQTRHLRFSWDGKKISKYFDFETGTYKDLPL